MQWFSNGNGLKNKNLRAQIVHKLFAQIASTGGNLQSTRLHESAPKKSGLTHAIALGQRLVSCIYVAAASLKERLILKGCSYKYTQYGQ